MQEYNPRKSGRCPLSNRAFYVPTLDFQIIFPMRKLRFTQNRRHTGGIRLAKIFSIVAVFFCSLAVQSSLKAQCAMTCNDDVNISLPAPEFGCEVTVTPDMVLEDPDACAGPYTLVLMTLAGQTIPNSPTVDETYIGQTLTYQVTDGATNNSCWGQIDVEDKLGPSIGCEDQTVFCVESTDAMSDMMPVIEDCSGGMTSLTIDFFDQVTDGDCDDDFSAIITRTWVASDGLGNNSSCTQTIQVDRVSLIDFTPTCPENVTLQCSADNQPITDPSQTGYPTFTVEGEVYDIVPGADNFCELASSFSDEVFDLCGGGQKILRTWTVYDWCVSTDLDENPYNCIQVIQIEDNEPPTVVCPAAFNVSTVGSACLATFVLPAPASVSDGCSDVEVFIITPQGIRQIGEPITLGVGAHTLTYVATDQCGNSSSCTTTLNINDNTAPVAVCDEFTIVALTGDGSALINAAVFDDGSDDNCEVDRFEVRRMNGLNCDGSTPIFDEYISFCCEDVVETVMVVFRVFDTSDNFNECMVEVEVQDKLDPTIVCPPDKTIECEGNALDLDDLDGQGIAIGLDNCGDVMIADTVDDQRTTCGTGLIIRTFTATDAAGRTATCNQTLTIVNSNPFDVNAVSWPADYETFECGASIDPDSLPLQPLNYRQPVFSSNSCDLIAVTYEDTYLPINPPACFKILRKWIVIDWCQYDPNDGDPQGYGEWTQIIKVSDNEAPVFDCPDELIVTSTEQDCGNAPVSFEPFIGTDCSPNVTFSFEIDLDSDGDTDVFGNGNDISGVYPFGMHEVTILGSDGCGNVGICSFPLTILDGKKPSPICVNGVAIELMPMGEGGMIEVAADIMDYGSTDNCTAQEDLIFELSPNVFDCADVGTNVVTLTVTDEAGNSDFCETYIIIQDNMNLCTDGAGGDQIIAGGIMSEDGNVMPGVNVAVSGNGPTANPSLTDDDGHFEFDDLQSGYDYTVQPAMNADFMNGVSTFDLVLIRRHVLGLELLDSPYKIIAADVNRSSSVTTSDIVSLRRMILGIDEVFPQENPSYRFVDSDYTFANPENPWEAGFPEVFNVNNLEADLMNVDFTAIKVGDVNGTAIYNVMQGAEERSSNALNIEIDDRILTAGEEHTISLQLTDYEQVIGYQFGLNFDTETLELVSVTPEENSDMTLNNFGMTNIEQGILLVSRDKAENTHNTNTIFTITFKAKNSTSLKNALHIDRRHLTAEAYTERAEVFDLNLTFNEAAADLTLYQNQPNPFKTATEISFNLPAAGTATLTVFDLEGKTLLLRTGDFAQGYNSVEISKSELDATGVMIYRLETAAGTATKKMVVLD